MTVRVLLKPYPPTWGTRGAKGTTRDADELWTTHWIVFGLSWLLLGGERAHAQAKYARAETT